MSERPASSVIRATDVLAPGARRRGIAAAIACVAGFSVTIGLTLPLLSLILESRGVDRTLIGLNAAMPALAMLLAAPLIPAVVRRMGVRTFLFGCLFAEVVLYLLLPVFDSLAAWFVIRFLMGASGAGLFVIGETWINALAEERTRGRVMGIYATSVAASFALGPMIIPVTGIEGWAPFLVGAAFILLAAVPLRFAGDGVPPVAGRSSFGMMRFMILAPVLAGAVLLAAFKETSIMALLPVYGVRSDMSAAASAVMLTAFAAGALSMQVPIGWLADRFNRLVMLTLCGLATGVGALALPLLIGSGLWLWLGLFLWGGLSVGVYTVAMVLLGERFRGAELVVANAGFGFLWGLGSLTGPTVSGVAMDLWDPHGLAFALAAAAIAFVALMIVRRLQAGADAV